MGAGRPVVSGGGGGVEAGENTALDAEGGQDDRDARYCPGNGVNYHQSAEGIVDHREDVDPAEPQHAGAENRKDHRRKRISQAAHIGS